MNQCSSQIVFISFVVVVSEALTQTPYMLQCNVCVMSDTRHTFQFEVYVRDRLLLDYKHVCSCVFYVCR